MTSRQGWRGDEVWRARVGVIKRQRSTYRGRGRETWGGVREMEKGDDERWKEQRGKMNVRTEMKGEKDERPGRG